MPKRSNLALPTRPIRRRGVVAVVTVAGKYLVVRRSRTVAAPGMYCFPGGGIEPGESECEAIRRELLEELGATFLPARRVWRCQTAWDVDLAWWSGVLAVDSPLCANPAEVESIHWFTGAELAKLPNMLDSNHEFLRNVVAARIKL